MSLAAYQRWADATEVALLQWGRPDLAAAKAPVTLATRGWPLVSFQSAFALTVGYLTLVALGRAVFGMRSVPELAPGAPRGSRVVEALRSAVGGLRFLYNLTQMALCGYMSIEAGILAYRNGYSLVCSPFSDAAPKVASLLWVFYLSKVLDFMDTFFIVVGKKWRQLSFLHVYHHASIFLVYWLLAAAGYDGDIYFTILLNGGIHFIMYTYYFVASHKGAEVWWKRYVTSLQLLQFTLMMAQGGWLLASGCKTFPPRLAAIYVSYVLGMFALFSNFYMRTYSVKERKGGASMRVAGA